MEFRSHPASCSKGEEDASSVLRAAAQALRRKIAHCPLSTELRVEDKRVLQNYNVFSNIPEVLKSAVLEAGRVSAYAGNFLISRSVGSLVGMAVADGLGHNFEFEHVQDAPKADSPFIEYPCPDVPGGRVRNGPSFQSAEGQGNIGQFM